jgi:uncharacterized membrane protein
MLVVEAFRMRTDLLGTMGLSAISGSRSVLGPALVLAERRRAGSWLTFVYALAAAELIADKLPVTPDRTGRGPLLVRCASGAWVGAMRAEGGPGPKAATALFGAIAALAGAFIGHRLRRGLNRVMGGGAIGNAVGGALEDSLALMMGARFVRRPR